MANRDQSHGTGECAASPGRSPTVADRRPPRIAPLPPEAWPESAATVLEAIRSPDGTVGNGYATVARSAGLLKRWVVFATHFMLKSSLPIRARELLVLRTAWNCASEYEWGHHVGMARAAGLSDAEIAAVTDPQVGAWSPDDAALLTAADELFRSGFVEDPTWDVLAARYSDEALIDLVFVVGHYRMFADAMKTLGVAPEDGLPPLPATGR